jgi:hypothetical protein
MGEQEVGKVGAERACCKRAYQAKPGALAQQRDAEPDARPRLRSVRACLSCAGAPRSHVQLLPWHDPLPRLRSPSFASLLADKDRV